MLLKHERQAYKVFFKALEEANLAISQSCMSKLREELRNLVGGREP